MYSDRIVSKVDVLFGELKQKLDSLIAESSSCAEVADCVEESVSSELTARGNSILSDMLFDLTDALFASDSYSDIAKQNRFIQTNLRQEILNKYHFNVDCTIDYKESSSIANALLAGGGTLLVGGIIGMGYVRIKELSFSVLAPIPVGVLIAASIGMAFLDYFAVEPIRNKKSLYAAIDDYLDSEKRHFISWIDDIEQYFNKRVEEIEQLL